jgi:hypothetical protein
MPTFNHLPSTSSRRLRTWTSRASSSFLLSYKSSRKRLGVAVLGVNLGRQAQLAPVRSPHELASTSTERACLLLPASFCRYRTSWRQQREKETNVRPICIIYTTESFLRREQGVSPLDALADEMVDRREHLSRRVRHGCRLSELLRYRNRVAETKRRDDGDELWERAT